MRRLLVTFATLIDARAPAGDYAPMHYALLAAIAVAACWLRLQGLGAVGLHGDEETMAMAVRSILDSGVPTLPSGNFYPRALTQLYLMAGSVALFGESEWALRLPSALAGMLSVALAAILGRRFLSPGYGVAFVAAIALLPELIDTSHTARMYIFHVCAVMGFALAVFRWEHTCSWPAAAASLALMGVALELHPLAIFALPIVLYPVFTRPGARRNLQAGMIVAGSMAVFLLIREWHALHYAVPDADLGGGALPGAAGEPEPLALGLPVIAASAAVAFVGIGYLARAGRGAGNTLLTAAGTLLVLSLLCAVAAGYPLAGVIFLCAALLYLRGGGGLRGPMVTAGLIAAILALQGAALMSSAGDPPASEVVKFLIAIPSPIPYFRFASYFPLAVIAYVALLAVLLAEFLRGVRLPGHVLFFVLAVWAPLVGIGFFAWNVPPRYTLGLVPFFALCLFAAAQSAQAVAARHRRAQVARPAAWTLALAVAGVVLLVPPGQFRVAVSQSYGHYPDHKGAAEFMLGIPLAAGDLVLAEDVLQQTYYLGEVDYWLRHMRDAEPFLRWDGSRLVDWYTATPVIADAQSLQALLARPDRGSVYVIGSGEGRASRAYRLGPDMLALFERYASEVIYTGRDGTTRIWRFPPPARAQLAPGDGLSAQGRSP